MAKEKLIIFIALLLSLLFAMNSCKKTPLITAKKPEIVWFKTYGSKYDDWDGSAKHTSDGGYIIVGTSDSFPVLNRNIYLIKTDKDGNMMWSKEYGSKYSNEKGNSVQTTSDGGYIVAGEIEKRDNIGVRCFDTYLVKIDSLGDTLWTKEFQGHRIDQDISVVQTKDGGYVVLASNLIKVDAAGNEEWKKSYEGYEIQETSDNGFIIVGRTAISKSGRAVYPDLHITKINENGNVLWEKTYGGRFGEEGFSVQQTKDGGYIIVGETDSYGAGMLDVYLIKTDQNGDTLWTRTYGGEDDDVGNSVLQTSDGGYIIAGWTGSFDAKAWDIYLIKTNENGDTLWTFMYGGESNDGGGSVLETSDGAYVIAGYTVSFGAGGSDIFLMKIK
jgi:hypothetical protein